MTNKHANGSDCRPFHRHHAVDRRPGREMAPREMATLIEREIAVHPVSRRAAEILRSMAK